MADLIHIVAKIDDNAPEINAVNDILMFEKDDISYMAINDFESGIVSFYELSDDLPPKYLGHQELLNSNQMPHVARIELIEIVDQLHILATGNYNMNPMLLPVNYKKIAAPIEFNGDNSELSRLGSSCSFSFEGRHYLVGQKVGSSVLNIYTVNSKGDLKKIDSINGSSENYVSNISDIKHFEVSGRLYLSVVSELDGGISTYRMREDGTVVFRNNINAETQTGFSAPQTIAYGRVDGVDYAAMIASGTSNLILYKVTKHGRYHEKDTVWDTLETRFQNPTHLVSITHEERSFIFVSGSDDGISVFEILPDATLENLINYEDNFDVSLTNISALDVEIINDEIVVIISGFEGGTSQFIFKPDVLGSVKVGSKGKDILHGTDADDYIFGGRKGDQLFGGDGNDRLDGGGGRDYLTGGAGADVFVFQQDNRTDIIHDFEPGVDKIDLSAFYHVGTIDDLKIKQREWGVLIDIRHEKIRVYSDDDDFSLHSLTSDDFIF